MRKLNTLALLFCCSLTVLTGQNKWNIGPSINFGISGKTNYTESTYGGRTSNLAFNIDETKNMPSFGLGVSLERSIGKHWGASFLVRYQYIQRFDKSEYTYFNSSEVLLSYNKEGRTHINHQIQTPLQIHFYFGKSSKTRPFISCGALVSYVISAKVYSKSRYFFGGEYSDNISEQTYDLTDEWSPIKRFGISPTYGIGLKTGNVSISINRTQNVSTQNYDYIYSPYFSNIYSSIPSKKIHQTSLSIRYSL